MKGDMRKVGLVSSIYLIIALLFAVGINQVSVVSAQQPCDNVTQYLEVNGFIEPPYSMIGFGNTSRFRKRFGTVKLPLEEEIYYVNCETGEVFDHHPTFEEVHGEPVPPKIDFDLFAAMLTGSPDEKIRIAIYADPYITEDEIDQLNQTVSKFSMVLDIRANVTFDQYDAISQFGWANADSLHREDFENGNRYIRITTEPWDYFSPVERLGQINETGADVYKVILGFSMTATPDKIEKISKFEWVRFIHQTGIMYALSEPSIFEKIKRNLLLVGVVVAFLSVTGLYMRKRIGRRSGGEMND